jgi:excisionase family DNA binding protein
MPESLPPPLTAAAESPDPSSRWLTAAQAARRANVGKETIYAAVRAKRLRAARVGGRRELRFLAAWVDAWLEATADESTETTRAATVRATR